MKVNNSSHKVTSSENSKTEQIATQNAKKTTDQTSSTSLSANDLKQQSQQVQRGKNRATKAILDATQTHSQKTAPAKQTEAIKQPLTNTTIPKTQSDTATYTSQQAILNILKELPLSEKLMHIIAKNIVQEAVNKGTFNPDTSKILNKEQLTTNTNSKQQTTSENLPTTAKTTTTTTTTTEKTTTTHNEHIKTKSVKKQQDVNNLFKQSFRSSNVKTSNTYVAPKVNTKIAQYQNMINNTNSHIPVDSETKVNSDKTDIKLQSNNQTSSTTNYAKTTQFNADLTKDRQSQTAITSEPTKVKTLEGETKLEKPTKESVPTTPDNKKSQQPIIELPAKQKTQVIKKSPLPEPDTKLVLKQLLSETVPDKDTNTPHYNEKRVSQTLEQKISVLINEIQNKQEDHQLEKKVKYSSFVQKVTQENTSLEKLIKEGVVSNKKLILQQTVTDNHINKTAENIFGIRKENLLGIAFSLLNSAKMSSSSQEGLASLFNSLQLPTTSTEHIGLWIKNRPDNKALAKALEQIQQSQTQDVAFVSENLKDDGKAIVRLLAEQRVSELRQNPEQNMSFSLPNSQNPEKPIQLSIRRGSAGGEQNQAHRERWNISMNFDMGKKGLLRIVALWEKKELSLDIRSNTHSLLYQAKSHIGIVEKHLSAMGIKQKGANFQLLPVQSEAKQQNDNESGLHIQI